MIAYVLGALTVGAAIGLAAGMTAGRARERRAVRTATPAAPVPTNAPHTVTPAAPVLVEPEPAEPALINPADGVPEAAKPPPAHADGLMMTTPSDVATNLRVAEAVLDVADRLASRELCRRLGDALRPLHGVSVLMPESGTAYDPALHDWVSTKAAGEDHAARTIAATKVPGMARADGTVVRKARVVVFE